MGVEVKVAGVSLELGRHFALVVKVGQNYVFDFHLVNIETTFVVKYCPALLVVEQPVVLCPS